MSAEAVRAYFEQYGMDGRIREFDVSSATVELAAQAVGCEPMRIAKTLSFSVGGEPVLIVAAGDARSTIPNTRPNFPPRQRCSHRTKRLHWSATR